MNEKQIHKLEKQISKTFSLEELIKMRSLVKFYKYPSNEEEEASTILHNTICGAINEIIFRE